VKAALLPQSCCQASTVFRRQQLTLFSSHGFYLERQRRQKNKPSLPHLRLLLQEVYSLLTPPVFKTGIYLAALAVLISARCRKAIRAGHPVPGSAPGSLGVTFGNGGREKPDPVCLSGSARAALALPPCLSLSHSCQLLSVFLKTA